MFLTVFTPCYNRAECLPQLYQSLQKQTCKDFEWIAIDDGSSDNTYDILRAYASENCDFDICVFKQKNGGKHRAINEAVKIARGKYFFIVDSDDYILENTICKIKEWCTAIECETTSQAFAGVAGLKMLPNQKIVGGYKHKKKFLDASNLQRYRFGLQGDKAEVYRTDLLRQFPFKEFEGENFLTEETVWNAIAEAGYKIRWYMEPIYVCEYREDGLTKNSERIFLENFEGYTYSTKERIRLQPLIQKIAGIGRYALRAEKRSMDTQDVARKLSVPYIVVIISKIIVKYHDMIRKHR